MRVRPSSSPELGVGEPFSLFAAGPQTRYIHGTIAHSQRANVLTVVAPVFGAGVVPGFVTTCHAHILRGTRGAARRVGRADQEGISKAGAQVASGQERQQR